MHVRVCVRVCAYDTLSSIWKFVEVAQQHTVVFDNLEILAFLENDDFCTGLALAWYCRIIVCTGLH